MPQSTPERATEVARITGKRFAQDDHAIQYLKSKGYTLSRGWEWSKPGTKLADMTDDEYNVMAWLIEEWDFGGLNEDS